MPKRLVSVFGGYEMGKSAISGQLAYRLSGVWYQTYPDTASREAARQEDRTEHVINTYRGIGKIASRTNLLVIDEDPIDRAIMHAFIQDKPLDEIEALQRSLSGYADAVLGDDDVERSYLHVTTRAAVEIDGKVHNPLLQQIAAHTLELHHHEGINPTPIGRDDAADAFGAAAQYARYLERQEVNIVGVDRNVPYDLKALASRLTS